MLQSLLSGLASGGAYAALGVCLVVMYRMVGVVSFPHAALGALGTYVMLVAHDEAGWAYLPAATAGLVAAAVASAALGLVMAAWFFDADAQTKSTVAIAMLIALLAIGFRLFGDDPRPLPTALDGEALRVAGAVVTQAAVATALGAAALALATAALLGRTGLGLRLRALSQRPVTAELLGIAARPLAVAVWGATGAIAAGVVMLVAPQRPSDFLSLSLLIVPALAAALVGVFRSLAGAVVGGLAIGLLEGGATSSDELTPYRTVIPFAVILVVLAWTERRERWDAAR
jgi:branched-chain amino acid transport system permease protein